MYTEALIKLKNKDETDVSKIGRLLEDKISLEKAIEDIKYLKRHAGAMTFTGNSGRIGEHPVMLRTVNINTLAGCVSVPALLIELAEAKLATIEKEAAEICKRGEKL